MATRTVLSGGPTSRHSDETIIEVKLQSMQGKDESSIANDLGINVTSVRRFLGRVKSDSRRSREALNKSRLHDIALQERAESLFRSLGGVPPPYNPVAYANVRNKGSSASRNSARAGTERSTGSTSMAGTGAGKRTGGDNQDSDLEQGLAPPAKRAKKASGGTTLVNGASGGAGSGGAGPYITYNSRARPCRRFFQAVEVPSWIRSTLSPGLQPPLSRGSSPASITSTDTTAVARAPADTREGSVATGNGLTESSPPGKVDDVEGSENDKGSDEPDRTTIRDIGGTPEEEKGLDEGVSMDVRQPGLDLASALASGAMETDAAHRDDVALSREEAEAAVRLEMAAEPVESAVRATAYDE